MRKSPNADLRALVVWEPVIWSDLGPPMTGVLARVSDRRAAQYWDPGRLLSKDLLRVMRADETEQKTDPPDEADIVWDCVAIYPPGVLWQDAPPKPAYIDCPVVEVIDEVQRFLSSSNPDSRSDPARGRP